MGGANREISREEFHGFLSHDLVKVIIPNHPYTGQLAYIDRVRRNGNYTLVSTDGKKKVFSLDWKKLQLIKKCDAEY